MLVLRGLSIAIHVRYPFLWLCRVTRRTPRRQRGSRVALENFCIMGPGICRRKFPGSGTSESSGCSKRSDTNEHEKQEPASARSLANRGPGVSRIVDAPAEQDYRARGGIGLHRLFQLVRGDGGASRPEVMDRASGHGLDVIQRQGRLDTGGRISARKATRRRARRMRQCDNPGRHYGKQSGQHADEESHTRGSQL